MSSFAEIKADLHRARATLPPGTDHPYLSGYQEFIDQDDFESACEMLQVYAEDYPAPRRFWLALRDAAAKMQLMDRAKAYDVRAAENMTPNEEACEIAKGFLDGSIPLVDACRRIQGPLDVLGLNMDEEFTWFMAIDSDAEEYPFGSERQHWDKEALAKLDKDFADFERFYRPDAENACRAVIARLGPCD